MTKDFMIDNCFLIGDAAHQSPPFMGQGMMSGYRDSLNLSWKLINVIKNSFPSTSWIVLKRRENLTADL
ncbi:MAG: hypothetical protein Ct9H300mP20_05410 [Gammaproteobacteria bacterium]|nr:MAG: hypothetical protein Ct9H300mP20_05410 [Gammaproteobacteria bacterium]